MRRHFLWILVGLMLTGLLVFSSINFAEEGKWTRKADMPTPRGGWGFSASVINGKIYAIGGSGEGGPLSTVEEYDPRTNKWTKKTDMPTARSGLSTSVVNGKIYAIGGVGGGRHLPTVEEYDPLTDKWTGKAIPLLAKGIMTTSAVNGKIYITGSEESAIVEEYDPATDTWKQKSRMPTRRYGLSASAVNGKIYAIGGEVTVGVEFVPIPVVEEYDPVTDKWTKKADMPTPRAFLSTSVVNGKIYAIGGWKGGNSVEEYDPVRDKWTKKTDMPTPRSGLSTGAVNGKIYAIGGSGKEGMLSIVEEYDTGFAEGVDAKGKLVTSWGNMKSR